MGGRSETGRSERAIPRGWTARPIGRAAQAAPSGLAVCVLTAASADQEAPVAGASGSGGDASPRVMDLPDEPDARVVLGALVDAAGTPHAWLRVAMQDAGRLARTLRAGASSLNNRLADARWERSCAALAEAAPGSLIATGAETEPAAPSVVEADGSLAPLAHPDGRALSLCRDDRALEDAGLAAYGSTLHRYLWTNPPDEGEAPPVFVALTDGAPMNEGGVGIEEVVGDRHLLFGGGLLRVTRLASIEYEAFCDTLGGAPAPGVRSGRTVLGLTGLWGEPGGASGPSGDEDAEDDSGGGWLFQTRRGASSQLIEALHLKTKLLADAVAAVEAVTRVTRRPMLNIRPELFGVTLAAEGVALPRLWTARVALEGAGSAVELPMAESNERVFVRASDGSDEGPTVFQPEGGSAVSGRCDLRLREIVVEDVAPGQAVGDLVVEGTFISNEAVDPSPTDLLAVHARLGDRLMTLRGRLEEDSSLAGGEWRFRSLRMPMGEAERESIRSACGAPLRGTRFELLHRLTSPRDLYGLMVLGVRTLLVDRDTTLPKAVDELLSLSRQVGVEHEESVPLAERIGAIFERDERWMESLGPQRLTHDRIGAREALDRAPRSLWYDTLGVLVRMAPGWGPDSFVSGLGDASPAAPHLIYEPVLTAMESLLLRSRSLVVVDWSENREMASVLRRARAGLR